MTHNDCEDCATAVVQQQTVLAQRLRGARLNIVQSFIKLFKASKTFSIHQHFNVSAARPFNTGSSDLPEYFPPLLLLIKQRMSRISSNSTTALTTPMNQPCVAMLGCTSVTSALQEKRGEGDRERRAHFFFARRGEMR